MNLYLKRKWLFVFNNKIIYGIRTMIFPNQMFFSKKILLPIVLLPIIVMWPCFKRCTRKVGEESA